MKPSDELLTKFHKIYFEEFGEEITRQQAYEKFLRLTNLVRVILLPPKANSPSTTPPAFSVPGFDQDSENGKIKYK
jgi:hypothetical protein